jgi:hypothetical protein
MKKKRKRKKIRSNAPRWLVKLSEVLPGCGLSGFAIALPT